MKRKPYVIAAMIFIAPIILLISGCTSAHEQYIKQTQKENEKFLNPDEQTSEIFRVLLSSEGYQVVQINNQDTIRRVNDEMGDKYISSELQRLDIIDESRVGIVTIWLYPDRGTIMRIRPQRPIYFFEIDALLNDDLMRWNFRFPKRIVEPTRLDIMYRVVLTKKRSDEEIIKEVQDMMKDR
jgi:hypothetical protein